MASLVNRPLAFGPRFDSRHTSDDAADPMLLSNPLDDLINDAFFSKLSNACQAPSSNGLAAPLGGYTLEGALAPGVLSDEGIDPARRDSLPLYELVDEQCHNSPQSTSGTTEPDGKRKDAKNPRKRPREETVDTPEATSRREVNLEKNRQAANKCRQKKRDWTSRLDNKHRQLSVHNKLLRAEMASLNDTVFEFKELVLRHADCGFPPISEYVRHEAEHVQAMARGSSK